MFKVIFFIIKIKHIKEFLCRLALNVDDERILIKVNEKWEFNGGYLRFHQAAKPFIEKANLSSTEKEKLEHAL